MFLDSFRPAIDSGLSVTRIGSNAQCKLLKILSSGIKNEFTNYRIAFGTSSSSASSSASLNRIKFLSLNPIFFQDHLVVSSIETTLILLLAYRSGVLLSLRSIPYLLCSFYLTELGNLTWLHLIPFFFIFLLSSLNFLFLISFVLIIDTSLI